MVPSPCCDLQRDAQSVSRSALQYCDVQDLRELMDPVAGQPSLLLCKLRRTPTSLRRYGANKEVVWIEDPDSEPGQCNLIVLVSVFRGNGATCRKRLRVCDVEEVLADRAPLCSLLHSNALHTERPDSTDHKVLLVLLLHHGSREPIHDTRLRRSRHWDGSS